MERLDTVVIGAGVIGLAAARALALAGRDVFIVEAKNAIGTETSSHNSEVIHAGIYYARASLKARFCVEGRKRLYAYCESRAIAHKRTGKLIVAASPDQLAVLDALADKANANGVDDLVRLDRRSTLALEPALHAEGALHSPSSGIIDSHGLMLSYLGEAQDRGAMLALETPVQSGAVRAGGIELALGGNEPVRILASLVVNCAGLRAHEIAARIEGFPAAHVPRIGFAKGNYFSCASRVPFSHLVYPVPEPGGLGVHVTLDLGGRARFGPDVEWIETPDYTVDPARAAPFYAAVRRYWPDLPDGALQPDYAGIRVKLLDRDETDFMIEGPSAHGVAGLINLFGIESPGLTSSLAIAEQIAAIAVAG